LIVTLLLAGGSSRRFGSDKLLAPLADGTAMVEVTARKLIAANCRVLAVVRPGASEVADLLARLPGIKVTECPEAERGMGHSLATGVSQSANASGWLVALGDMPFVQSGTIRAVAQRLEEGASIVAPSFAGKRGHPVGFASRWRGDLQDLTGDLGGSTVIRRHFRQLLLVPCDDAGVLQDLDLPSDLVR
jgi:molybdenum cofactor cytidylyltransferase